MASLVPYSSSEDSNSPEAVKASKEHVKNNQSMLETGLFSDFQIVSNTGKVFNVHKNVLSAQSKFFKAMFESSTRGEVTFHELNDSEVEALLKFIYLARIPRKEHRSALMLAGDKVSADIFVQIKC